MQPLLSLNPYMLLSTGESKESKGLTSTTSQVIWKSVLHHASPRS